MKKISWKIHFVGWLWHPVVGALLLVLPLEMLHPPRSAYISFNWMAVPVLAVTMYFWLRSPSPKLRLNIAVRNAAMGVALSAAFFWFFAMQALPHSSDMPISREKLLVSLAEGSAIGLYIVQTSVALLCAVCLAASAKSVIHSVKSM